MSEWTLQDAVSVLDCPHCGNKTPSDVWQYVYYARTEAEDYESHYYMITRCGTCAGLALRRLIYKRPKPQPQPSTPGVKRTGVLPVSFTQSECEGLSTEELLWPNVGWLPEFVPERIRKIYTEATAVKAKSPNAFANQIRRGLEAICKDKGHTKGTLADKLKSMGGSNEIPDTLTGMTDLIRVLGNHGSHDSDIDVQPEWVDAIDEFFLTVVEYVYIANEKINDLKDKLSKAKIPSSGT